MTKPFAGEIGIKAAVADVFKASTKLDRICVSALRGGATYQQVADALGITRQATWALYHEAVVN
jgi:hypothetical protein